VGCTLELRMLERPFYVRFATLAAGSWPSFFRSRTDTALELVALRQQVTVLKTETSTTSNNRVDRVCGSRSDESGLDGTMPWSL